jgi:hypothetical protein
LRQTGHVPALLRAPPRSAVMPALLLVIISTFARRLRGIA